MSHAATVSPAAAPSRESARSVVTLVLGVLGLCGLGLLSPLAWILGVHELNDIRHGVAPAGGEATARTGMVLGIVGTVLMAPFILLFGLLAILLVLGAWIALLT